MEFLTNDTDPGAPEVTDRVTTSSNRTKRYLVAAGLIAGGVTLGALFSPIGLAGAQSGGSSPSTTAPSATNGGGTSSSGGSTTAPGPKGNGMMPGRGGKGGGMMKGGLGRLATTLGIPAADLQTGFQQGRSLLEIAQAHGLTEDQVVQKLKDAEKARLDQAVKDGRLTQDQADQRLANADARIKAMISQPFGHPGMGKGGMGFGFGRNLFGADLNNLATTLGIDAAKLRTDLGSGKTLAEAASAQNVSADKLRSALTDAVNKRIDKAVTDGHIDQATADKMKANIGPFVDALMNWKGGPGGMAPGMGREGMGRGGMGHGPGGGWGHGPGGPGNGPNGNGPNGNGQGPSGSGGSSGSSGSGQDQQSSYTA